MKTLIRLAALALFTFALPALPTGCAQAPSQRVVAVQTLKVVGQAAEEAVATSARLYRDGKITAKQARDIADNYDRIFQPAFRIAKDAVLGNVESVAPANVIQLSANLVTLVAQLQKPS